MPCFLGLGDCGNILNGIMTNVISKNSNSATATSVNLNSFTIQQMPPTVLVPAVPAILTPDKTAILQPYIPAIVSKAPNITGCSIIIGQSIKSKQSVKLMAKITNINDFKTQIKNAIKTEVSNETKQKAAFLQTAANEASTATKINDLIDNRVETNITNETISSVNAMITNANSGILLLTGNVICPPGGSITNMQEIITSQIAELLTTSLTGTTLSNDIDDTSDTTIKNKIDQEGKGLFSGLEMLVYAAVAIVALIILGVIAKLVLSKGVSSTPAATAVAFGKKLKRMLKVNSYKKN